MALDSCAALPGFLLTLITRRADLLRKIQELLEEIELALGPQVHLETGSFVLGNSENRCNYSQNVSPFPQRKNGSESQKKKGGFGASKPLFSSAKQTRRDIIFLFCI